MSVVTDALKDLGGLVGDVLGSDLGKVAMVAAPMMFGMPPGLDMAELGAGEAGMFSSGTAGGGLGATAFGASGDMFGSGMEFGTGAAGLGGGGGLWSSIKGLPWNAIGAGLNAFSGVAGLSQARQMQSLARDAFRAQDPFGAQRPQYQQQLQELMRDPNSVTNLPGYQFGLDQGRLAIERKGAASGSGGNEAIALAQFTPQYAQQFYNQEIQRLMNLSGANVGPSTGPALSGFNAGADIYSRALSTLGKTAASIPTA